MLLGSDTQSVYLLGNTGPPQQPREVWEFSAFNFRCFVSASRAGHTT